jgi:protein NrfC
MRTQAPTRGSRRQYAHLWDASLCIHCNACSIACTNVNHADIAYAEIADERGLPTNIRRTELPHRGAALPVLTQCQQCGDAPCLKACPVTPTKAIYRDANGLVLTDEKRCIKCQLCVAACPYQARWTHPVTFVPQSCMGKGCRALVASGRDPACVQACPTRARAFGDALDRNSAIMLRARAEGTERIAFDKGTRPHLLLVRS